MKSNILNFCLAVLTLCVSIFAGCDGGEAKTGGYKLDHHQNIAPGNRIKVSVIVPPAADTAGLSFEWKASKGKFDALFTTELSNFYTAPDQAATDEIRVNVWRGNTLLDPVNSAVVVGGAMVSGQATPVSEQSSQQSPSPNSQATAVPSSSSVPLDSLFFPAGWMGDAQAGRKFVQVDSAWQENPHSAPSCYKWTYRPSEQGWAAVAWQYPENNFGKLPGRDLTGFSKVTVWLRGERGDETITLKAGGHTERGLPYQASYEAIPVTKPLTREWQKFEIQLSGKLTNIPIAFVWVATRQENSSSPIVFYLDDLQLEK